MPRLYNLGSRAPVPEEAVYIGRNEVYGNTKYGNPFRIGVDGTREEVISMFREYLLENAPLLADVMQNLKGKDLACHCYPLPCHGDVLLQIANPPTLERLPL